MRGSVFLVLRILFRFDYHMLVSHELVAQRVLRPVEFVMVEELSAAV